MAKAQATIDKRQNEIDAKTKERLELAEDKEKAGPTIRIDVLKKWLQFH